MEGAGKQSTLSRLFPYLAQDLIKEADCSTRREDVGGALEDAQLMFNETWKHLMERNNKFAHLFIQQSFLKGGDGQGGCRMTEERKATVIHPCSP